MDMLDASYSHLDFSMSQRAAALATATAAACILIVLVILSLGSQPTVPESERISVVATIYPLAEFARQVGSELVDVQTLTPAGVEPHEFEPTPRAIAGVYEADVFLINGGGVDAWATTVASSAEQAGVQTIEMSTVVGEEAEIDEHYWLSPARVHMEVEVIRDALMEIDPEHANTYNENAERFISELETLDTEYKIGLASCEIDAIVTSHAAFGYLSHDYGFEQIPITGISPEEEPSAGTLAEIAETAKRQGVTYIFFETLVSPELAETLAEEIGAQTLVLNPLEGLTEEEMAAGKNYLSIMRENLVNLRTAMVCE